MIFISDLKISKVALEKKPSVVVIAKAIFDKLDEEDKKGQTFLISENLPVSHALLKQKYLDRDLSANAWPEVHPSAVVHESVNLSANVTLGPNVVIEKDAKIGEGCHFMANVVVEHGAQVGANTVINPGTIVGYNCIIGKNCTILSNSVIGSEGMGYTQDEDFNHYRVPQTGIVRIGDRVTIGACNTIDRAAYDETVVGNGTIYDNICHTAHNVKIGENCILLSGFLCAGSTVIGDRVIASGQTMLKDHVNVCDDTLFVHRAGIIKDITEKGAYAGSPTQPMKQYMKNNAALTKLAELSKKVKELEKKLES